MLEKEEHLFERLVRERNIPCAGDIPTADEWLRYVVEKVHENEEVKYLY